MAEITTRKALEVLDGLLAQLNVPRDQHIEIQRLVQLILKDIQVVEELNVAQKEAEEAAEEEVKESPKHR